MSFHIALLTAGTRGDVQPFVALARGLLGAGHSVTLAAPVNAAGLATAHGVPFAPMRADFQALLATDEARAILANPLRAIPYWRRIVAPLMRATLDDAWTAARGADVLVFHPKVLGTVDMAERLGARAVAAVPAPMLVPTRAFPAPGVAVRDLGGRLNRATYALIRAAARPFAGTLARWRADVLGLGPRPRDRGPLGSGARPVPVLHAFSAHVVPRPGDWPAWAHLTGYWFLGDGADAWSPPAALQAFLTAGPPPVYVGFGSIAGPDPRATTRVVLDAVRRSGHRAVIATGWGGLTLEGAAGSLPDGVHLLDAAPHEWLFPRVAAVVHHGGAGTTAAGLRAGRATVVCPFFGDQPFWGARVAALGVGPAPLPQRRLNAAALAAAIRAAAGDPGVQARAEALGARLRAEDGVATAVTLIEEAR